MEFIKLATQARYLEKTNQTAVGDDAQPAIDPANIMARPEYIQPIGDVMDLIGIKNVCCRVHCLTTTRIE